MAAIGTAIIGIRAVGIAIIGNHRILLTARRYTVRVTTRMDRALHAKGKVRQFALRQIVHVRVKIRQHIPDTIRSRVRVKEAIMAEEIIRLRNQANVRQAPRNRAMKV